MALAYSYFIPLRNLFKPQLVMERQQRAIKKTYTNHIAPKIGSRPAKKQTTRVLLTFQILHTLSLLPP